MSYSFSVYTQNETVSISLSKIQEMVSDSPLEEAKVQSMMRALKDGKELAPIVVRKEGEAYRIIDGNHRCEAAKRLGHKTIEVTKESVERSKLF